MPSYFFGGREKKVKASIQLYSCNIFNGIIEFALIETVKLLRTNSKTVNFRLLPMLLQNVDNHIRQIKSAKFSVTYVEIFS